MPNNSDFGVDTLEQYGVLTYIDDEKVIHEEKIKSVDGDYGRVYDDLYEAIINNKDKKIKDEETLLQLEILEEGIRSLK